MVKEQDLIKWGPGNVLSCEQLVSELLVITPWPLLHCMSLFRRFFDSIFTYSLSLFQQKLNELRQWTDKVRAFDKTYTTENGLFFLDCVEIHNMLVPRLTQIFQELCDFISEEAFNISKKFQKDIDAALDVRCSWLLIYFISIIKNGHAGLCKMWGYFTQAAPDVRIGGDQRRRAPKIRSKLVN